MSLEYTETSLTSSVSIKQKLMLGLHYNAAIEMSSAFCYNIMHVAALFAVSVSRFFLKISQGVRRVYIWAFLHLGENLFQNALCYYKV